MLEQSSCSKTYYEFFAGSGMVRAGLGNSWKCLFANDFDEKKAVAYQRNWGVRELLVEDVGKLLTSDLPNQANLAWASFPCQDLSLAGSGAGLNGRRSGTFWPFWGLIQNLQAEGRQPNVVVLENVCGALTSHNGADFQSLMAALGAAGYRSGALVIDASLFVPQSRPRLFIVGVKQNIEIALHLDAQHAQGPFHTKGVITAFEKLPASDKANWVWWNLPSPPVRQSTLADIVENDIPWHLSEQTKKLLALMSPLHRAKVKEAQKTGNRIVGTIYRRTRPNSNGSRQQRAEVRFDDTAGCLRTPGGGSSRQTIIVVQGKSVHTRLLSAREAARLMGLPDEYELPENYNDAYHLMGDGVVVPVVSHLSRYLLDPLVNSANAMVENAA